METPPDAAEIIDDGQRRDRRGRVNWPKERQAELVAEYETSGLSQAAFARRAGVKYPTFAHWVQRRRRAGGGPAVVPAAGSGARFVELRLPTTPLPTAAAPASELSVILPDGMVLRGAQPQALAALVRALREA